MSIERPFFNLDLSLYFLQYVDRDIARKKLKGRVIFLKRIKRDLEKLNKEKDREYPKHMYIILEHDLDLVEAEIKSISRLVDSLK